MIKSSRAAAITTRRPIRATVAIVAITMIALSACSSESTDNAAATVTKTVTGSAAETVTTMIEPTPTTVTVTTTANEVTDTGEREELNQPANNTAEPANDSTETFEPITLEGTGDDVLTIDELSPIATLTFDCPACSHNVTVETDSDGLLVNAIGAYHGTHLINMKQGSSTRMITVGATGSWTITIEDVMDAPRKLAGDGDSVIIIASDATKAAVTYDGEHNFVIKVHSQSGSEDLAINTIGAYNGTVPFDAPAIVEVTASGHWTIDPS